MFDYNPGLIENKHTISLDIPLYSIMKIRYLLLHLTEMRGPHWEQNIAILFIFKCFKSFDDYFKFSLNDAYYMYCSVDKNYALFQYMTYA